MTFFGLAGTDWTNTFDDRACKETELNMNLIDLRRSEYFCVIFFSLPGSSSLQSFSVFSPTSDGWDFGNYLMVYDADGAIVFLATNVADVAQAKCVSH